MLYAASVKVSFKGNQRRLDIIVEAENLEQAKEKALKQARKIYAPGKKAVYSIFGIINEAEALESYSPQIADLPNEAPNE